MTPEWRALRRWLRTERAEWRKPKFHDTAADSVRADGAIWQINAALAEMSRIVRQKPPRRRRKRAD